MRSQQQTRRIQNAVMKSPSPDIANRNIIKDTKTPIEDVKRYLEKSSHSRSPRLSELTQSAKFQNDGSELQYLRQRVKELQIKNMQLMAQNDQFKKMLQEKAGLQGELARARQTLRSYGNSQVATPKSQDKNNNKALQQMQERVVKLLSENTRLGQLLQDKQGQIKGILNDSNRLKGEADYWKTQAQAQSQKSSFTNNIPAPIVPAIPNIQTQVQDANMIKNYYEGRIQPEMRRSESEWLNRLRQLSQRMSRIQDNQRYIQRQMARRSSSSVATPTIVTPSIITPIKPNQKSPLSNKRTDDPGDYSSGGIQLPQSVKPFQSMTMRSTNKQSNDFYRPYDDNMLREVQAKCGRLERDNEGLRRRIVQLQDQLKKVKEIASSNIRPNQPVDDYIRRINELEEIVDGKNLAISNGERQLRSLRQDYSRLKERTEREMYLLQNQRNTCKKAFEQEKQKSSQLDDAYAKLNERYLQVENRLRQKQKQGGEQLRSQIRAQSDARQANMRNYYEQLLKNKDRNVGQQLHQYLIALNSIRKDIQDSNYEQIIQQSESALNERVTVERQISYIRQENQRIIQDLKTRLIQQEQRIIQLEKDNQLLRAEVHELQIQKEKLKKAMFEFDVFRPVTVNTPANVTTSITTSTFKNESGCRLKTCLKETLKKIDDLEHQITEILME